MTDPTSTAAPDEHSPERVGALLDAVDVPDLGEPTPARDLSAHRVVAVLVAHDGDAWLPRTLAALAAQERPAEHVVGVDTGSNDQSLDLLQAAQLTGGPVSTVLRLDADTGFAAAVEAGVEAAPDRPAGHDAARDWVWVLHDDSAPDAEALSALLAAADAQPSLAVVGPKVVGWDDPRRLLEVGVSISRSGRRDTGLERHEQDQGQHDGQRDVLAVGSAGALIRRDVWDALGGFDRRIRLFRDDVDLGWRANAAGHRVAVVSAAVVHHVEASARGRRPVAGGRPHRTDRASALYVMLANAGSGWLPFTWVRLLVVQLLRALALALGKAGAEAADELAAAGDVLLRPGRVRAGRRARRGSRAVSRRHFRALFPPRGQQLRQAAEWVSGLLATGVAPEGGAGVLEPVGGDEDTDSMGAGGSGVWRRRLLRPAPLLTVGLLVGALIAWRGLYRGGALHGGALLPLPSGASDLWASFTSSWHPVGQGSGVDAPPSLALLAASAGALLGHAGWAATLMLLLAVPLSGLAAWLALGPLDLSARLRLFAAVTYALSPSLVSGVAQGRLGTAVTGVLVPFVGWAGARAVGVGGRPPSVRAAAAASLLLAVVLAFAPVLWLPAVALALLAALTVARGARARLHAVGLVVVPVALLLPWSLRWFTDPSQLALEAGLPLTSSDDAPWRVLLLDPGGPVHVPGWLSVGLLVAAVAAVARVRERAGVRVGLVVALVGLLAALVLATITVTPSWGRLPVVPWAGPALLVATAGLLVAIATAARGSRVRLSERALSWQQPALAVVTALALVVPVVTGMWWLGRGSLDPLVRSNPNPLPAFVQAKAAEPERVRTLVLQPDNGRLGYTLLRDRPAEFGDVELMPDAGATAALDELVSEIASGRGGVAVTELSGYAVQFILATAPVDPTLETTLDSVPGLVRVSSPGDDSLWRLELPTGRLQLGSNDPDALPALLPSGEIGATTSIPGGSGERRLLLSETADGGWRATLSGKALPSTTIGGWAQGFTVPASGGTLELSHQAPLHTLWLLAEGVLVVVVLVAALPARRRDEEVVV